MLQFDGSAGLLIPGGPQTTNPNNFAVPNGLQAYYGFDADCLDFTNNKALSLVQNAQTLNPVILTPIGVGSFNTGYTVIGTYSAFVPGTLVTYVDTYSLTAYAGTKLKILLYNGSGNYTLAQEQAWSHGGTGWERSVLSSPFLVPSTGSYYIGFYISSGSAYTYGLSQTIAYKLGDVGTDAGYTVGSGGFVVCSYIPAVPSPSGTLSGFTAASMINGQVGQALRFNGSTSYVDITSANVLITDAQSLSFFLTEKGTDGYKWIFARGRGMDQKPNLGIYYQAGNFYFGCAETGYTALICAQTALNNGDHVCLILNYPSWKVYQNGQILNSGTSTAHFNVKTLLYADYTNIGRLANYNGYYWNGALDDVRFYNRDLDQNEVIELYKSGLAGRRNALNYYQNFMPMLTVPSAISQWQLYFSKNSGAYEPVTTTSVGVNSADASSDADETKILIPRL